MTLFGERLRTLHERRSELSKPATALLWPGSPFPLPLKHYGGLRFTILLIVIAAGMVLAIACANVASLQLASYHVSSERAGYAIVAWGEPSARSYGSY